MEYLVAFLMFIFAYSVSNFFIMLFFKGHTNFTLDDDPKNNLCVALSVFDEGLQNNDHVYPSSLKFSYHWWKSVLGYFFCRSLEFLGLLEINHEVSIPSLDGNLG